MLPSICFSVQTAGRKGQTTYMLQQCSSIGQYKDCSRQLYCLDFFHGSGRQAMLSALQSGTTLIVDRYSYSGVVFTAAKELPGLDLSWCKVLMPKLGPCAYARVNVA